MGRAGLFDEDARVELLDGQIVEMAPIGSRHAACVTRLNHLLVRLAGDRAGVSVQNPVQLDLRSEPVPDLALLRPPLARYAEGHPGPDDVLLVVEVADSSLAADRDVKAPRYGRAGVPVTWVVDLSGGVILVFTEPEGAGYRSCRRALPGEALSVPGLPSASIAVTAVLSPACPSPPPDLLPTPTTTE